MEEIFLFVVIIPIGLFIGWLLGISAWRQVRRLRKEVAALRTALREAGIAVPDTEEGRANPTPWVPPAGMRAEAAPRPPGPEAAQPRNPWAQPPTAPEPAWHGVAVQEDQAAQYGPPAPPPPADTQSPGEAPKRRPGLEELLTLRWGTWLGAGALLLAGVFLLRTAIEEGWLGPVARCALAAALAFALIVAAEWLRRRPAPERPNIPWPDQAPAALAAGGVAILFGAAYATASMYALVPSLAGFVLMGAAALVGIALALTQGPLVAAIGIAGAYLTPALVETNDPSLPGLFAYLLVVTAAALAVVRQVAAAWLGWAATIAASVWVLVGGVIAPSPGDLWAVTLFVPAAAALHLALLPGAALDGAIGRRLGWIPFAVLAAVGLTTLAVDHANLVATATGMLLLTPVAVWKGATEPRMDRLPWVAALAGLLLLLAWPLGAWAPVDESVTVEGVVQAILPTGPWAPEALWPFLVAAMALAGLHAAAGAWLERRAPHPLRWAALPAAVPVLALLVAYARVRGFELDGGWAMAALALAAALVGLTVLAGREAATARAGVHAAGAVAALALGAAMLLSDQWLTLAVALFLPPLAWIEGRAGLPALRQVAVAVAGVVLVRLLLNWHVLDYALGTTPVLNGLLPAYGVPAASFALAAFLFRRRGDDLAVAVLEAGAVAFATVLVLLQMRHAVTGGEMLADGWTFREAALQTLGLALLAAGLRMLNRRLGNRPVLRAGWRLQQGAALVLGTLMVVSNPALDAGAEVVRTPVLNELLLAYAIPALLAALAARTPEAARPREFRQVLAGYAFLAAFAWVTLEVRHLFHPGEMALAYAEPFDAELYAYSGAWLVFGGLLLALGIRLGQPALRLAALAVMGLTVAKAVLVDMEGLVGLWRVLSFLGLGLALIALGWVYRRFVVRPVAATE
jgi:uncharacterized membrane protein